MFRLNKLHVKNWCQHTDTAITLSPDTNGIVGSNGRGKSNLIGGAFTLLTGRVLSDTLAENINFNADKAQLDGEFVQNGVVGTIKRTFMAKRMELQHDDRDRVKSTAKLEFADLTLTGTKKVSLQMEQITGFAPGVIENHIFISQDKLSALLFQQRSDRIKSFLSLIPGLDRAEAIRGKLLEELNRHPELELAVSVDTHKDRLKEVTNELVILEAELSEAKTAVAAIKIDEIRDILEQERAGADAAATQLALTKQLEESKVALDELLVKQAEIDTKLAKCYETERSTAPEVEVAKTTLTTQVQARSIEATRAANEAALTNLLAEIDSAGKPDDGGAPWTAIESLAVSHDTLKAALTAYKQLVPILESGGVCPTCGNEFDNVDARLSDAQHQVAALEPKVTELTDQIQRLHAAKSKYESDVATHNAWLNGAQERLTAIQDTLKSLPAVELLDEAKTKALEASVDTYNKLTAVIKDLETDAASIKTSMATHSARIESDEKQLDTLTEAINNRPDAADVSAAKIMVPKYEDLTQLVATLNGKVSVKKTEVSRTRTELEKADAAVTRMAAVIKYRQLLTVARDILHREKLPQEVLMSHIGELDRLCNKFLDMFGNPFAVKLDRDMDLQCVMPNGYVAPAQRLSGGQKSVLSVVMRFAINEMFAKDLGLIVLDEPTQWMDGDNIDYMRELISQVHTIGKESGVQTIIITHKRELIPSFEHVIDLN